MSDAEYSRERLPVDCEESLVALWRASNVAYSDAALFWGNDDKFVITSLSLDTQFINDVSSRLGWNQVCATSPRKYSDNLSDDILDDSILFEKLIEVVKASDHPELICWGVSIGVYRLIEALAARSAVVSTSEIPSRTTYWTAMYFDSKIGFRETCLRLSASRPEIRVPAGFICSKLSHALDVAKQWTLDNHPFVLKANFGEAGFGTIICDRQLIAQGWNKVERSLEDSMTTECLWKDELCVIEEYIRAPGFAPIYPTCDGFILSDGSVEITGSGLMLISEGQHYSGVEAGLGVLPRSMENLMESITREVGKYMSDCGFLGWFDVDFVVGAEGALYLTEFNARRTGPAHLFETAKAVYGPDWASRAYVKGNDYWKLNRPLDYGAIHEIIGSLHEGNCTVLPTMISRAQYEQPKLGYAIVGPDRATVANVEQLLHRKIEEVSA